MSHPLTKLDRAKQHLKEFNTACAEFAAQEPYTVMKQKSDPRRQRFRFHPGPPHLGLVFGEVVHSLRSALDHVVYELTRDNIKNLPRKDRYEALRRSSFPICTTTAQWERDPECFNGGLDKAGSVVPDALAVIKGYQPFSGFAGQAPENHPLALLRSLDNRDKHRKLVVMASTALAFRGETSPGSYWYTPADVPRQFGAQPTVTVPVDEMQAQAAIVITLDQVGPPPGLPVWLANLPDVMRLLMLLPEYTLPDVLLAATIGIDRELRVFLPGGHLASPPS